ncbi:MAG: acetoin utilization protein AcuC [Candidatus Caldarchaeum sp.]|nr:acetoin utilization protein AcuC [Candidatus Caldarchaeum sp.]MDW7978148.1 acetoin utilization protein AcuC [Candidatus Caldarchaeum sp.]MDW8359616.1 acetoin utilization protein AcuC [Candidatus Caldarchaeum sp.]
MASLAVAKGDELFLYSFPEPHPLNRLRLERFYSLLSMDEKLLKRVEFVKPVLAGPAEVELFHTEGYVRFVQEKSRQGYGYLDYGDTPAFPGCYEAAAYVVGTTIELLKTILNSRHVRAFNPMGGLHHARRDRAGGFCIFNDAAVAIEYLLRTERIGNVAYVDIDAHHGDGVCYDFYSNERVIFADIHQDGRTLYPGTGFRNETGEGRARGTKLNIPLMPFSGDEEFMKAFDEVLSFLERFSFDFVLFQTGADGLRDDPLTSLQYSPEAHMYAAKALKQLAEEKCGGRVLAMGGGGYNPDNVARAWKAVVEALAENGAHG